MKDADFDRAVEAAAEQLVRREPRETMTDGVMARIQSRPRVTVMRPVWIAASLCAVVLSGVIGWVMMSWPPAADPRLHTSVPAEVASPATSALRVEPVTPPAPANSASIVVPSATRRVAPALQAPVPPVALDTGIASALESLQTEPLVVTAIELAALETPAVSVEQIQIEDITIEPLTASND